MPLPRRARASWPITGSGLVLAAAPLAAPRPHDRIGRAFVEVGHGAICLNDAGVWDGQDNRLPKMAADLDRHHVAVIATPLSSHAAIAVPT